jgi:YHS domain-containing protein
VAYFTENKAVEGLAQFSVQNTNGTWHFASLENKQRFEQSPEKYLPQYGGYCAYAMSYGLVVSSDPYAFSIIDNKLYLNYSLDVREKWLKKPQQFIKEADAHWQKKI